MADVQKIIATLQSIVTPLSQQADGHAIQSRVFNAQGLTKLAEKYAEHADEERGYVQKCVDRILDLGGEVKNESKQEMPIFKDPIEFLKADLQISKEGLAWLKNIVEESKDDFTTYDMLKDYYKDEETDMYWTEQQLELIDRIGLQNWFATQI